MAGIVATPIPPRDFTPTKKATADIQKICDEVKEQFIKKAGVKVLVFEAIEYRVKVADENYFLIKVHIGRRIYIFLYVIVIVIRTHKPIAYQLDKKVNDELIPF